MTDYVYLDNASTCFPKPRQVIEFMCDFYSTHGVNPGRSSFNLALEAEEILLEARQSLCDFFGGRQRDRLVFGHNVTDALNLVIASVLKPGDHAVSTCLEHNSVLRPLYYQRDHFGVEVDFLPFDAAGYVHPEQVAAALKPNTKLVVMNHGSNVIGTVQAVAEVGAICREHGVLFVVDAAQTAGIVPIDVEAMNIDFLCFTGHKSLYGPSGTGGMYVAEHVDIDPCRSGGTGIESALKRQPDELPWRLECGTLNLMGISGLLAAQRWIAGKGGVEAIRSHEMELANRLRDALVEIPNLKLYCADMSHDHLPVFSFNIEGLSAEEVGAMLDVEHGVIARTGLQCAPLVHKGIGTAKHGTVRFSVGAFNTASDVERAIAGVREIAAYAAEKEAKAGARAAVVG